MKRRSLIQSLAGSLVGAQLGARAAEFSPSRPIMLILPFAPGGSTDAVARALADALRARLGQPVVIDNKPGAGGAIANEFVARAAPDGHTLLLAGSSLTMNPALSKVNYDPVKSFTPLSQVLELEIFLVTRPDIPVRSLQELIAYAKARPGSCISHIEARHRR
jgi:tripartite-type tricarboxylate transporter receptor subunit TctC